MLFRSSLARCLLLLQANLSAPVRQPWGGAWRLTREAHAPYIFSLFWLVLCRFSTVGGSSAYGLSARLCVLLILIFSFCFLVFCCWRCWPCLTFVCCFFSLLYLASWWAFSILCRSFLTLRWGLLCPGCGVVCTS